MRTEYFHVDSKHREGGVYGTAPNFYRWRFPHTIRGVHRVEVLYAEIPNSQYNVPNGNILYFQTAATLTGARTTYSISITPGNYNYATFETAINAALVPFSLTADVSESTGKLSLYGTGNYVWFLPPSTSRCYGVSNTFEGNGSYCTSLNVVNLNSTMAYFLRIPELGQTHNDIHTSGAMYGSNRPGVIGRFQNTGAPFDVNCYKNEFSVYFKKANPAFLLNLTEFTVEWIDTDGYGVDFNGADHSFFLKVTYEDQ